MNSNFSVEKTTLVLMAMMKIHGINKVIVSPGSTNMCFVGSIQKDPYFTLYSAVDERSAAYIACGLAAETGEPVALSCTGATASRNYLPGLTEAYYRKLPVLAITSTQHPGRVGTYKAQVIDRSQQLKDIVVYSAQAMMPVTQEDEWLLNLELNKALLALKKNGGGPVHINLMTTHCKDFSVKRLPSPRIIDHFGYNDKLPELKKGKIAIFVGSHIAWSPELRLAVDEFCNVYDAVVFCEHISNYKGAFKVPISLISLQEEYSSPCLKVDTEIYIGYISGAIMNVSAKEVWRVNPDGEIRDYSHKTSKVFQMEEVDFFRAYVHMGSKTNEVKSSTNDSEQLYKISSNSFLNICQSECQKIYSKIPDLPFSNAWIAQQTSMKLPEGCILHFGIINSLRVWNFFNIPDTVLCYANTGGYGIDGDISSLLGASLAHSDKIYIGVVGDLAFFYDMNVLGNRHVGKNIRLMLVNNGCGTEFSTYNHVASCLGDDVDPYIAAAGHYGNKSRDLVKHYAEDLGFDYICADDKESYLANINRFVSPEIGKRPLLFEVFTDSVYESKALEILYNLGSSAIMSTKKFAKNILGEKGTAVVKNLLKKDNI